MIRNVSLACLAAGIVLSSGQGCANWERRNQEGAVLGGIVGAGAGALIGSKTGSWAWGALIGAGTGALAGYVIADNTRDHYSAGYRGTYDTEEARRNRDEADREFRTAMEARDPA